MSNAHPILPLQSAIAAWALSGVAVRPDSGVDGTRRSGMMHAIVPFPIYRGLTR
jgi:hypothetical protein